MFTVSLTTANYSIHQLILKRDNFGEREEEKKVVRSGQQQKLELEFQPKQRFCVHLHTEVYGSQFPEATFIYTFRCSGLLS